MSTSMSTFLPVDTSKDHAQSTFPAETVLDYSQSTFPYTHIDLDPRIKTQLFPHQSETVEWMLYRENFPYENVRGGLLLHEMGLGKTLCTISTIVMGGGRSLIVVPAQLVYVWESEIKNHLDPDTVSYFIYHGPNRKKRFEKYMLKNPEPDILIISYQSCIVDIEDADGPIRNITFDRMVLDECHYIKNQNTKVFSAINKLKPPIKWFLSGTPIMNRIHEMYPYLKLLNYRNMTSVPQFLKRGRNGYIAGRYGNEIIVQSSHYARMQDLLRNIAMRRTKEILDLPEKIMIDKFVDMNVGERDFYDTLKWYSAERIRKLMVSIKRVSRSGLAPADQTRLRLIILQSLLSLLFHLRMACCDPILVIDKIPRTAGLSMEKAVESLKNVTYHDCPVCHNNDAHVHNLKCSHDACKTCWQKLSKMETMRCFQCFEPTSLMDLEDRTPTIDVDAAKKDHVSRNFHLSSKTEAVMEYLKRELDQNKKVIVVSQWTTYLDRLIAQFKLSFRNVPFVMLDGRTTPMKRQSTVDKFQDDPEIKVAFASLGSSAEGITLHSACSMVLCDVYWNMAKIYQISDRIHRIGQKNTVQVTSLYVQESIEIKLKELCDKKDVVCRVVVGCEPITSNVDSWLTRVIKLLD